MVAGPGATKLGESLYLVDMFAVLLILPTITLGVNITHKMWRQAGLSLLYQAGEEGGRTGTITGQWLDIMAPVSAGLSEVPVIAVREVALTRVFRAASSTFITNQYLLIFIPKLSPASSRCPEGVVAADLSMDTG